MTFAALAEPLGWGGELPASHMWTRDTKITVLRRPGECVQERTHCTAVLETGASQSCRLLVIIKSSAPWLQGDKAKSCHFSVLGVQWLVMAPGKQTHNPESDVSYGNDAPEEESTKQL